MEGSVLLIAFQMLSLVFIKQRCLAGRTRFVVEC